MQIRIRDSLQYRLGAYVIVGLFGYMLLSGGIRFAYDYQQQLELAQIEKSQLVRTVKAQAEVAAFARNDSIADDILDGLLLADSIAEVELASDDGFVKARRKAVTGNRDAEERVYTLQSPIDASTRIGELRIVENEPLVRDRAVRNALKATAEDIALTFITVAVLALVFHRIVGRPVAGLARQLRSLQPDTDQRLQVREADTSNEIGQLAASANLLLDASRAAIEKERALRLRVEEMETHYRRLFDTTTVGIFVLNSDGLLVNCNKSFRAKLSRLDSDATQAGSNVVQRLFLEPDAVWSLIDRSRSEGGGASGDLRIRSVDGRPRWAHCIFTVTARDDGRIETVECVVYDVTARREGEEQARRRAETDVLTQVLNRHGIDVAVDRMMTEAVTDDSSVALFLIDLDGFKEINDTHGHAMGDLVLKTIAQRLEDCAAALESAVGRLGGDEFIVAAIVPEKGDNEADTFLTQFADRLVAAIAEPVNCERQSLAVRVGGSVGVSVFPENAITRTGCFRIADGAMYDAKRAGKNRFIVADARQTP